MKRALLIGLVCFTLSYIFRHITYPGPGDLLQALRPAADLLAGLPPLAHPTNPLYVPSPLTIIPLGLPFAFFEPRFAGALFIGLSCAWLAYALSREPWRWLIFLSPAMFTTIVYVQYAPLLMALALFSAAPLGLLVKPHIALPLVLTYPARRAWWAVAFIVCGVSLLVYPLWPVTWLAQLREYQGAVPALMPLGFGLLLALLRWRDPLARMFVLYALMPQRGIYDTLPLLLVPQTRRMLLLVLLMSWIVYLLPLAESARILLTYYVLLVPVLIYQHHRSTIVTGYARSTTQTPRPAKGQ